VARSEQGARTKRQRDWRQANKEKKRSQINTWRTNNPEKARNHVRTRRARRHGAHGHATPTQVAARVEYFGGRCAYCGGPYESIDHAIPLARGGTHWPSNLRPACMSCNAQKGARTVFEFTKAVRW
jgi:5-methylcytosine-specific restriction endonuclease McrA